MRLLIPARTLSILGLGVFALISCDGPAAPMAAVRPLRPDALGPQVAQVVKRRIEAVNAEPSSGEAHGILGIAYEANSLWPEALQCFEQATVLAPGDPIWPYHAAIAHQGTGDVDAAYEKLLEVTEAYPDFAPAHHRLGDLHFDAGAFDLAQAAFQRASTLEPDSPVPYVGLSRVALVRRNYEEARALLEKALAIDPGYKMAHFLIGTAYRGLGRPDEAQTHQTLGVDPIRRYMEERTFIIKGQLVAGLATQLQTATDLIRAGQPEKALVLLERAQRERPDDVNVLNNLAVAYQKTQQYDRALELLFRLRSLDPEGFAVYINLSECMLELQRHEEAMTYAQRAVELAPKVGQAHFALGRALLRLNRPEDAYEPLKQTVSLDTRNPEAYLVLAECCMILQRYEEALDPLLEIDKRIPGHLPTQLNLCAMYRRLGNLEAAEKHLRRAQQLAPTHPRVLDMQARLERDKSP